MGKWRSNKCSRCGKRGDALHKVKHTVECLKASLAEHEQVQAAHVRTFGHEADLTWLRSLIAEREASK